MPKTFLTRASALVSGLLISLFALFPVISQAGDIDEAFKNLTGTMSTSIHEPGQYSSQARNAFVLGGADVRFPSRRSPTLFSVTPFSFSAGCGGISTYFGGFSFISGDEIKQLIKSVAQNAVGVAIELVITTLCGPCAHVMQVMRSLAKDAAKTSIDSCAVAHNLIDASGLASLQPSGDRGTKDASVCSSGSSDENKTQDYHDAMNGLCSGVESAANYISELSDRKVAEASKGGGDKVDAGGLKCANGSTCNRLWQLLNKTNLRGTDVPEYLRAKVILMNVIGTTIMCPPADKQKGKCGVGLDGSGAETKTEDANGVDAPRMEIYLPPQLGNVVGGDKALEMDDVFSFYMCGTDFENKGKTDAIKRTVVTFCSEVKQTKNPTTTTNDGQTTTTSEQSVVVAGSGFKDQAVWDCASSQGASDGKPAGAYEECLNVYKVPMSKSPMLKDAGGYLVSVLNTLQEGVDAVRTNDPKGLPPRVIELIQLSPVPLYQAINAAAVYPDAGAELVSLMGTYVAQLLVYADLRQVLREAERLDQSHFLSDKDIEKFYSFLGGMRGAMAKAQDHLVQRIYMQDAMMANIRSINLAIQREVLSEELLGPARFGTELSKAAQQAAKETK